MTDKESISWINALNDQTEWKTSLQAQLWLEKTAHSLSPNTNKVDSSSEKDVLFLLSLLSKMRNLIYQIHFIDSNSLTPSSLKSRELTSAKDSFLSAFLSHTVLSFDRNRKPALRASLQLAELEQSQYCEVFGTLLLNFATDLSRMIESGDGLLIHRCEGLFRDHSAAQLTNVDGISDSTEELWRKEIALIVEQSLEKAPEIQRCADLFLSKSRSKYCSDACRFTTFQIAKQLQDPNYLAEKQRRYRRKKSDAK